MPSLLRKSNRIIVLAFLVSLVAVRLEATPLAPGGVVVPSAVGLFNPGLLLASTSTPFATIPGGLVQGTLHTAAYENASGLVDFYYQVVNNSSSKTAVHRLTAFDFTGFTTSVAYSLTGFGIFGNGTAAPVTADRSIDGSTVGFNFSSVGVAPGSTSAILAIATNGTEYVPGFATIINSGVAAVNAYGPAQVPEPASATIALLGFVGLVAARRRRKE